MKIYLVSTGEYSDYHIIAAFSTRELAEAFSSPFDGEWSTIGIEEYTVDEKIENIAPPGMKAFSVTMAKNGDVLGVQQNSEPGGQNLDTF